MKFISGLHALSLFSTYINKTNRYIFKQDT